MERHPIILAMLAMGLGAAGCRNWDAPPPAPAAPPSVVVSGPFIPTGPALAGPPTAIAPSVLPWRAPQAVLPGAVVPGAAPTILPQQVVPIGPPLPAAPPAPAKMPGILGGTSISPEFGLPAGPEPVAGVANPLRVPVMNEEYAWEQITAVVSDYFRIAQELRARRVGDVWSEGFIDTVSESGATYFEPHRRDSVGRFNRWESTFQTIRRRANVRVLPDAGGYAISLEVHKEIEDLPRPEIATAGAAAFRNNNSLATGEIREVSRSRESPIWLSLGRDIALEQRMLAEIQARLQGPAAGPALPP